MRYRAQPETAREPFRATAELGDDISCTVQTWAGNVSAGLHPAAGGDGTEACSADMLLQALVACAGVTLTSVATAFGLDVRGRVRADGELDFRGTLGMDRAIPVGFRAIRLSFELETEADDEQVERLIELTERYCVVLQTILGLVDVTVTIDRAQ